MITSSGSMQGISMSDVKQATAFACLLWYLLVTINMGAIIVRLSHLCNIPIVRVRVVAGPCHQS